MIRARIDTDSVNTAGDRIVTWILTYHRYVHADLMTHRDFSRNGASSRAIPMSQMLRQVWRDPAVPIVWGRNGRGMQAHGPMPPVRAFICRRLWLLARLPILAIAWVLMGLGLHKQWTNRLIEPWLFMTVIVTATEHDNFLDLRDSPYAQPEIAELARQMRAEMAASTPVRLEEGEWHIPLLTTQERDELGLARAVNRLERACYSDLPRGFVPVLSQGPLDDLVRRLVKVATARAARISYVRHEMIRSFQEDEAMHDRLRDQRHWSPFEHCAEAAPGRGRIGNFHGWAQYRKQFPHESGSRREL